MSDDPVQGPEDQQTPGKGLGDFERLPPPGAESDALLEVDEAERARLIEEKRREDGVLVRTYFPTPRGEGSGPGGPAILTSLPPEKKKEDLIPAARPAPPDTATDEDIIAFLDGETEAKAEPAPASSPAPAPASLEEAAPASTLELPPAPAQKPAPTLPLESAPPPAKEPPPPAGPAPASPSVWDRVPESAPPAAPGLAFQIQKDAGPASTAPPPRPRRLLWLRVLVLLLILACALSVVGLAILPPEQINQALTLLPLDFTLPDLSAGVTAESGEETSLPTAGALLDPTTLPPSQTPAVQVTVVVTPTGEAGSFPDAATLPPPTLDPDSSSILQRGAVMLHVPGGTFTMGVPGGASNPAHEVTLDPYYIDQVEVTNAMYAVCVEDGGCEPPGSTVNYYGGPYYGSAVLNNYPVASVSWFAAEAYCAWRGARLPSEAEWEMAARWDSESGEVTRFPWGDDPDPLRANYCDANCPLNSADPGGDDGWELAAPVGSFLSGSSPVGALDMAGNVAEWVADWFGAETYQSGTLTNPRGPFVGTNKIVRGGAWGVPFDRLASTERSGFPPGSESVGLGFRCAASADEVDG